MFCHSTLEKVKKKKELCPKMIHFFNYNSNMFLKKISKLVYPSQNSSW